MPIVSLIEYIFCLSEFLRCLTIYDYFVTVVSLELGTGHTLFFKECQQFRKKGSFLRHFHWKRVIFWWFKLAFLNKRGPFFFRKYQ